MLFNTKYAQRLAEHEALNPEARYLESWNKAFTEVFVPGLFNLTEMDISELTGQGEEAVWAWMQKNPDHDATLVFQQLLVEGLYSGLDTPIQRIQLDGYLRGIQRWGALGDDRERLGL
jgi:hypothetical protein